MGSLVGTIVGTRVGICVGILVVGYLVNGVSVGCTQKMYKDVKLLRSQAKNKNC